MKEVDISKIAIGVRFSAPVYFEDGESMFLAAGSPVSAYDVNAIRQWHISRLYSDGTVLSGDATAGDDAMLETLDDAELEECEPLAPEEEPLGDDEEFSPLLYKKWIYQLDAFFSSVTRNNAVVVRPLDALAHSIARCIGSSDDTVIRAILDAEPFGSLLARNSVHTAVFSGIIAGDAGCSTVKREPTITAALLHDVGMLFLPPRITGQKGKLPPQDLALMQKHTETGRDFVEKKLMYSSFIGAIVYQHHEFWQGGGYPCNISGDKIHYEACIVAVADAFAAMLQDSAYRESLIGYDAVKELLNSNSKRFNPEVLKYFIIRVGLYPVGSFVILNDSSIARVLSHHSESALRPIVQLWIGTDGTAYENGKGPVVDLKQRRDLFIVRVVNPKDFKDG